MKRREFIQTVGAGVAVMALTGFTKENVSMEKEPKATFFVSTEGNDSWSGKLPEVNADKTDGPFATIAKAKDAIRHLRSRKPFTEPITVMVRGGTYYLKETLVFEPIDSGTKDCPITYMAYPGEKPVISGGKQITGGWKPYKDNIMVRTIDEVKEGKWYFRRLSVNGKNQVRARVPREGEYLIEAALGPTSFRYKEGQFMKWHNISDAEVLVFHSWNETRFLVSELDESQRAVKFKDLKARHGHVIGWSGTGGANRYYIDNVKEGLTGPGAWYLDRQSGELFYWPEGDMADAIVVAPVLKQLIRFDGGIKGRNIQYININGFTLSDTDWPIPENGYPDCGDVGDIVDPSAITLQNVRYCKLENNIIKNTGTYGLEITGYGNKVIGNEIYDTGGGGIICRNYDDEINVFSYNHIHNCGEVYPSAVGINIDDGGGLFSHNLIHNIAHSGIYTRHWADSGQPIQRENQEQGLVIEYNEIYDVMERINDGGGLFVRDSNIIIRNNLIHDVYSYSSRCPGWGIYLGCETRDAIVENNIVYRAREVVHVWYYDRNIVMQNNIFMDGEISQINYQNPKELTHDNIKCLRNIFCYSGEKSDLFRISHDRSLPVESDYNVFFHTNGKPLINRGVSGLGTFEEWQKAGFDTHSLVADPMFLDPANDNYSLKPDSPALKLGFKAIDMSTVGLRGRKA